MINLLDKNNLSVLQKLGKNPKYKKYLNSYFKKNWILLNKLEPTHTKEIILALPSSLQGKYLNKVMNFNMLIIFNEAINGNTSNQDTNVSEEEILQQAIQNSLRNL